MERKTIYVALLRWNGNYEPVYVGGAEWLAMHILLGEAKRLNPGTYLVKASRLVYEPGKEFEPAIGIIHEMKMGARRYLPSEDYDEIERPNLGGDGF